MNPYHDGTLTTFLQVASGVIGIKKISDEALYACAKFISSWSGKLQAEISTRNCQNAIIRSMAQ